MVMLYNTTQNKCHLKQNSLPSTSIIHHSKLGSTTSTATCRCCIESCSAAHPAGYVHMYYLSSTFGRPRGDMGHIPLVWDHARRALPHETRPNMGNEDDKHAMHCEVNVRTAAKQCLTQAASTRCMVINTIGCCSSSITSPPLLNRPHHHCLPTPARSHHRH
jgi:hypothetical protein